MIKVANLSDFFFNAVKSLFFDVIFSGSNQERLGYNTSYNIIRNLQHLLFNVNLVFATGRYWFWYVGKWIEIYDMNIGMDDNL